VEEEWFEVEQEELGVTKARSLVTKAARKVEEVAEVAEVAVSVEAKPATQSWAAS